jgi:hypothetical protein
MKVKKNLTVLYFMDTSYEPFDLCKLFNFLNSLREVGRLFISKFLFK